MKKILTLGFLFASLFSMHAKVELPPIFADNMVLQQQTDAALWGYAKPNAKVTITTTWSKDKTIAKSDADGKWFARVSTPVAGGPYDITFSDMRSRLCSWHGILASRVVLPYLKLLQERSIHVENSQFPLRKSSRIIRLQETIMRMWTVSVRKI